MTSRPRSARARTRLTLALPAAFAAFVSARGPAYAYDEFADAVSPRYFALSAAGMTLVLKGELEVELHDIEGEGGPGFDSPTDTRTLGTRSPFVELDAFWLGLRLQLLPELGVNSVLEFTPRGAGIGAAWFDAQLRGPRWLTHHAEAGLHTPFVKIERRTERYPLIATITWREPEFHLTYEAQARVGGMGIEGGASVAMMRPLAFAPVQESTRVQGTINVIAYGPARTYSGNGPVVGGKLGVAAFGARLTGFAFLGQLAAEAGTDELRNAMAAFRDLPGYDAAPGAPQDRTFYWAGGRLSFDRWDVHAIAEVIVTGESLLRRAGAYGQVSYAWRLPHGSDLFHTIEPLFRYEIYRVLGSTEVRAGGRALRSPSPSQALTWDYDITTFALVSTIYRDSIRLRLEYYLVDETNGVPALGIPHEPLADDELLVQLELRF